MAASMQMFDEIMKNVQKELQEQVHKVKAIDAERQAMGRRIGQLESQIAECKVVLMELNSAPEDSKCYKVLGPVLLDQTLEQSKENIVKRGDVLNAELSKMKKLIADCIEKFKSEKQNLDELNAKAKQIKAALEN